MKRSYFYITIIIIITLNSCTEKIISVEEYLKKIPKENFYFKGDDKRSPVIDFIDSADYQVIKQDENYLEIKTDNIEQSWFIAKKTNLDENKILLTISIYREYSVDKDVIDSLPHIYISSINKSFIFNDEKIETLPDNAFPDETQWNINLAVLEVTSSYAINYKPIENNKFEAILFYDKNGLVLNKKLGEIIFDKDKSNYKEIK